ncbi:F-box protein [Dorcoceras hygrometricum]|uniref:F-box protein n=1 Tax=Dorcoceras hygrometricum TaxID=472368 RepID=A0A2Z7CM06_9LAMI|nr:F-box protein [Dorcoceras hygrometricum]
MFGQPRSCSVNSVPVRSTQIVFGQPRSCSVNSDLRQPTQLVNSKTVKSASQQSDTQHSWSRVNSALDWSTQLWTVNSDLANSDLATEIQIWLHPSTVRSTRFRIPVKKFQQTTESPRKTDRNKSDCTTAGGGDRRWRAAAGGVREVVERGRPRHRFLEARVIPSPDDSFAPQQWEIAISPLLSFRKSHSLKSSSYAQHIELSFRAGIMYLCDPQWFRDTASRGPQPLWLRNHNFELAQRIMVKRLATSRHDPLGITDSACKNQLVVVSVQYGPFNTYIPIRSTTIGKSRVARDPIAMHTSWRSNSDIASYNQDLGIIHSTNGNHLESPNEGSSIDHQVTIHLHAQNITMFPTNETWYFASQMLVSSSGGFIVILTAQSKRNEFRIHSDY